MVIKRVVAVIQIYELLVVFFHAHDYFEYIAFFGGDVSLLQ